MAAPSNAAPAYSNAGYEQAYYHQDPFWTGQPPVAYGLPPLTDLGTVPTSTVAPVPSSSTYEMPEAVQSMYYMPYYMPSLTASYSDPAALAAAAASSYPTTLPVPGDASNPLHNFYLQQQQQPFQTNVPITQSMMTTPSYPMPTQISPPIPHFDYTTMGYAGPAPTVASTPSTGMGVRTSSTGGLPQSSTATAAVAQTTSPIVPKVKKSGKKPKVEGSAPASIRSAGDSDFDENDTEDDHDRRKLNNIRERVRVKDINNAFHELGDMVNQFDNSGVTMEKQQTKLGILHNAVELIKNLEEQVKRRNLARNMADGPPKPFPQNC